MTNTPDRRSNLSDALRAVAREDADRGASLDVQARLLNEVRAIGRARRQRRIVISSIAVAASLVVVAGMAMWQWTCCQSPEIHGVAPTPARTVASTEVTTGFMPLMYATVPMTGGHIVRMQVPARALMSYGLALPGSLDGAEASTVLADVLVGNDGLARAVRFVRPALK